MLVPQSEVNALTDWTDPRTGLRYWQQLLSKLYQEPVFKEEQPETLFPSGSVITMFVGMWLNVALY
ncbi:Protein of unknown function [Gryllus bimaculatus]|nr:Protein of unknown function [Gryllus bimaculatus]